jgi:hypothetical protein
VTNDLDTNKEEIPEETLKQLAEKDALAQDFYQLSLNALTNHDTKNSIKLKARVQDKVMLILLHSSSSHSFVN